ERRSADRSWIHSPFTVFRVERIPPRPCCSRSCQRLYSRSSWGDSRRIRPHPTWEHGSFALLRMTYLTLLEEPAVLIELAGRRPLQLLRHLGRGASHDELFVATVLEPVVGAARDEDALVLA